MMLSPTSTGLPFTCTRVLVSSPVEDASTLDVTDTLAPAQRVRVALSQGPQLAHFPPCLHSELCAVWPDQNTGSEAKQTGDSRLFSIQTKCA